MYWDDRGTSISIGMVQWKHSSSYARNELGAYDFWKVAFRQTIGLQLFDLENIQYPFLG